jgi:TRAP-type mannitol/chloroaromatic compound transport system permease large subunit
MRKRVASTVVIATTLVTACVGRVVDRGGDPVRAAVVAAVSMAGPFTVLVVRRRRTRRGADDREHALVAEVQSRMLRDILVVLTVAILVGVVQPGISAALMACGVLLVALADFRLRCSHARRTRRALPAARSSAAPS